MNRRHLVLGCLVTTSFLVVGAAAPASTVDYVALGDSYSSGVGAPGQSGSCARSPNGFPGQWVAKHAPKSFTDLTCGGAVTGDVLATQAPAIPSGTDLISITIGGNDAGFAPIVLTCQFAGDATCTSTVDAAIANITATLPAKLDATYAAIKAKAPAAKVIVLGYPLLFDTASSSCGRTTFLHLFRDHASAAALAGSSPWFASTRCSCSWTSRCSWSRSSTASPPRSP
ncbi:hypothetical protein GCM10010172_19870 [Paractinoplanes ferrugineus]|uniref:SGNH hydrolase-type esterase domain-containing protein n=1 Tax=Paractinoplanes ferrugineus TaxID=113564 RepID=A0A919J068_9ACTN|nr:SGNH/GDSL hydrolase family protein [Actinoplanes ferrugineus]GIE12070.1 hypothetical protein Afe05nite_39100 [Actinoplanes ferrugineus]